VTVVGVLGGGQLGRMLALAGARLGLRFRFYDESPDAVAGHVGELVVGSWDDHARLDAFAAEVDVVTLEFENVPAHAAERVAARAAARPAPAALAVCQDRLREKALFTDLGIDTPAFRAVDTRADLDAALRDIGLPAVLKTRRMGYDGKGQAVPRTAAEADAAWARLSGRPLIVEAFVPFQRELSVLALRSTADERASYPLTENVHRAGMLRRSRCPAPGLDPALQRRAEQAADALLHAMGYAGLLAIEFFEHNGRLLANEMAPRVHNSGHWTIDGAVTSQFENHLRAVLGLPLGGTAPIGHAGMVNLIGGHPPLERLCGIEGARVHLYAKEPRPGRKIGHVNLLDASASRLESALAQAREIIEPFEC
jgi:5-(carboxyamino)imidazole ribonucleotide synthase